MPDEFTPIPKPHDAPAETEAPLIEQHFDTQELAPAINAVIEESKAGWKTTEFWVALVVSLLTVIDTIPLPEKFEGVVVTGIAIAYALSRGLAKKGVANVTPVT